MKAFNLQKTAFYGLGLALAVILSYLEFLIPLPLPAGIKIGFANIVTVFLIYNNDNSGAILISVLRVLIINLLFGSVTGFLFGLSGTVMSFLIMILLKKSNLFSMVSVSAVGGIVHNIAQLLLCVLIMETTAIFSYLVLLVPSGLVAGILIGIITHKLLPLARRIDK